MMLVVCPDDLDARKGVVDVVVPNNGFAVVLLKGSGPELDSFCDDTSRVERGLIVLGFDDAAASGFFSISAMVGTADPNFGKEEAG